MDRKAFLLGFYSTGGQVIILRELVAAYNGDELFLGIALFGWLLAVALGAWLCGALRKAPSPAVLFPVASIVLPLSLMAIRLSPMSLSGTFGEIIPFYPAALMSIILSAPTGFISGALFTAIAREGIKPAETIGRVYLFEGIGAFIGGVGTVLLIGPVYSGFGYSLALAVIVNLFGLVDVRGSKGYYLAFIALILLVAVRFPAGFIDRRVENIKYPAFDSVVSFDTHYGRETILRRGSSILLLTDNTLEGTYPDIIGAEDLIIPPLLYRPDAKNILYIGLPEFGPAQIADSMENVFFTAIDPRSQLDGVLDTIIPPRTAIQKIINDPVRFFRQTSAITTYDIIIINAGPPDNYRTSRMLSYSFLSLCRKFLSNEGVLYVPTGYDTDRYVSEETDDLLGIIRETLAASYPEIEIWPGNTTLFFASPDTSFNLSPEMLAARIDSIDYRARFFNASFLRDRFGEIKTERLSAAIDSLRISGNSLKKPILPYYQAIYRSKISNPGQNLFRYLAGNRFILFVIPLGILLVFLLFLLGRRRRRYFGLFLYLSAGLLSLSLELLSFYLYQSYAGTLYSELGGLIGAFMLGLAVGTYFSLRYDSEHLEFPALLLFLTVTVLFSTTYNRAPSEALFAFHLLFLFTMAAATGTLFVAATNRYYFGRSEANRGLGYAFEIGGSSIGALLTMTVLLPLAGLHILLVSAVCLILLGLAGSLITARYF